MGFLEGLPVVGGFFDDSLDKATGYIDQNRDMYANMNVPAYKDYTPEELQYLGDYSPEEVRSQQIAQDPQMKAMQMQALGRISGLAETGLSAQDEAAFGKARLEADRMARSNTDAAMQNARARGVAGGGMEFALREQAAQNAAERQQQAGLSQAEVAAKQRAMYNSAMLSGAGDVRSQGFNENAANTDIVNRFNTLNTGNRNQASLRNLDTRQGLSNQNIGERNQAQQYNNQLKNMAFQNQATRNAGMAGANQAQAERYYAEQAANAAKRKALGGAAGTAIGAAYGGPQGAAVGNSVGQGMAG